MDMKCLLFMSWCKDCSRLFTLEITKPFKSIKVLSFGKAELSQIHSAIKCLMHQFFSFRTWKSFKANGRNNALLILAKENVSQTFFDS